MSLKILLGSVALGIALVIGAYFVISPQVGEAPSVSTEEIDVEDDVLEKDGEIEASGDDDSDDSVKEEAPVQTQGASSGYTKAEVATHASESSCWTTINGGVYDVTVWIGKHPGGEKGILKMCGKDGTSLFEGQHGGGEKQEAMLATFRIGDLI